MNLYTYTNEFIQKELEMFFSDYENDFTHAMYTVSRKETGKAIYSLTLNETYSNFATELAPQNVFKYVTQIVDDVREVIYGAHGINYKNWNDVVFSRDTTFDTSYFDAPEPTIVFMSQTRVGSLGKVLLCLSGNDLSLRDLKGRIFDDTIADIKHLMREGDDFRRFIPQYSEKGVAEAAPLYALLEEYSQKHNCTWTQLCLAWILNKRPYLVPILAGLLFGPGTAVAVVFGLLFTEYVILVEKMLPSLAGTAFGTANSGERLIANFRGLVDGMVNNKSMIILMAALFAAAIAVSFIRRLAVENAWTIAITAGSILELVILLIGDMRYGTEIDLAGVFVGIVVSFLLAQVVRFFIFNMDYLRVENVQFEDDDYYYYVKAVPKVMVFSSDMEDDEFDEFDPPVIENDVIDEE